jgi:hypothetical protein
LFKSTKVVIYPQYVKRKEPEQKTKRAKKEREPDDRFPFNHIQLMYCDYFFKFFLSFFFKIEHAIGDAMNNDE